MNGRDYLLTDLLRCGSLDLKLLDDVGYDWCDIIVDYEGLFYALKECQKRKEVGLNHVMWLVVEYGKEKLEEAINDRICELEAIPNERELDENEEKELKALNTLNPYEDVESSHNCLDTHVWFEQNGRVYKEYLSEALDEFANGTGFNIEGCGED